MTCNPTAFTKPPDKAAAPKAGHIPREKVVEFFEQGYTVVEDYFTDDELYPCKLAIERMVDETVNMLDEAGKITELHADADVFTRLTLIEQEFPGANVLLFKTQKIPKEFIDLWTNPRLLDCCEQFIGPDVACHPVWNLRVKTPNSPLMDIPWHQDSAYFDENSYDHLVLSAWIPFLDATPERGCLQMVRRGQVTGKVATHTCCVGPSWYVMLDEKDMAKELGVKEEDFFTVPVKYGGMVLFSNIIPHRSLPNTSDMIRWSVDLRWQSPHYKYGFYDIQPGVLVRDGGLSVTKPDWETYLKVNRKEVWQTKYNKKGSEKTEDDPFDLTITGPWIGRWELTNHNQHTKAFQKVVS